LNNPEVNKEKKDWIWTDAGIFFRRRISQNGNLKKSCSESLISAADVRTEKIDEQIEMSILMDAKSAPNVLVTPPQSSEDETARQNATTRSVESRNNREEKDDSLIKANCKAREEKNIQGHSQAFDGINATPDATSEKSQRDLFKSFLKRCATSASDQNSVNVSPCKTASQSEDFNWYKVTFQKSKNHANAKLIRFPTKTDRIDISEVLSTTPTEYSPFDEEPDILFPGMDKDRPVPHIFSTKSDDEMSLITTVEYISQNLDDISLY